MQGPAEINPFVLYSLLVLVMLTPVLIMFHRFFKKTAEIDKKYKSGSNKNKNRRKR